MKKLNILILSVLALAGFYTSCTELQETDGGYNWPAVRTYSPETNASTTVLPGQEVTLEGVNLQNARCVIIGGVEAKIVEQGITVMKVIVPLSPDFRQAEVNETFITMYSSAQDPEADPDDFSWRKNYFVYVEPVDAIIQYVNPEAGTVGDLITLTGHNLSMVTAILFGSEAIDYLDFVNHTDNEIVIAVPDAAYAAGDNNIQLSYIWGTSQATDVIDAVFTVKLPAPASYDPPAVAPGIGEQLVFTGENLTVISSVQVDGNDASFEFDSEGNLLVTIPNANYGVTTGEVNVTVVAYYGEPAREITLGQVPIDGTPLPGPEVTSVVPEDGGPASDRFYLQKKVTLTGDRLVGVDEIYVGGLKAEIEDGTTNNKLVFTMPVDFGFNVAQQVEIVAYYGGERKAKEVIKSDAMVYPFFYWKDVKIGSQKSSHTQYFFVPDNGVVYSADEWVDIPLDRHALTYTGGMPGGGSISAAVRDAIFGTGSDAPANYYATRPYFFFTTGSSMAIQSTSNSTSQLKNFKTSKSHPTMPDKAIISTGAGTPVVYYRPMTETSGNNGSYADSVRNGNITSLLEYDGSVASAGGPKYDATLASSGSFNENNCVVLMQYVNFDKLAKPSTMDDIYKSGFVLIKSMSGIGTDDVVMTVDCYWPNNHR